ncbi:serine/threonine kinase SAD-1 isoform X1 [Anopheles arabiensis]|uniref:SNF-related serine/threonine-protein kinase n=1 Tax=Anopheles arabiensis TaxID=7173 RepID=A0A2C9GQ56_ANOAR|nr:serine/threonine kinase SAD-1 isoform X1 [Anopheles arabiensis]XP_040156137.1 serine/threonine kinase SAD-1 isoform X1 [Anopheles arabiensis]XP_040156144.1 serine/threonine kinase SAD-1 isoform X1 [Anopheles arabiensis]
MQRSFGGLSAASRAGVYDGKIAGLYDLEETLGSGHFAVVKLARHVFTGEKVAVKVIEKTKLDEISRAHLFQEVRCMKLVQHPNVVRLYEVIDTQTKLYLILELGDGGDLYDYIMRHEKGLSENVAREYFRQIVRAISYCHQLHVVHRDLKPENVVFFEKLGVVKLTDFGFSNKFCPGQKLETSCGSLAYSAPEILLGDSYDAPAVDVWSLGVILFMLVCGHPPFQEANDSETLTMIMDCKYTMPAHVSDGCRNLISKMLVREPEKRATLQQIALDVWLMEGSCEETPENQPLVSREQVSEEDHTLIIQKMINGKIATKEEILEALDRNEYNHITATYFLLAERKLRAHRQEEAQKRKPELTLPVSNSTRLLQNFKKNEANEDEDTQDGLLSTRLGMHLSVPRTPGTETGQTGRSRKCSIVQEEEDDEDDVHCAGHEELSTPLNRRGSRSEGRINVTVQDRIAESERLKLEAKKYQQSEQQSRLSADEESDRESQPAGKDQVDGGDAGNHQRAHPQTSPLLGGIGNVTLVTSENSSTKDRLGIAGGGLHRKPMPELKRHVGGSIDSKKSSILKPTLVKITDGVVGVRSGSFDQCMRNMAGGGGGGGELVTTKIITDSSTITIPIPTLNIVTASTIPKYKTMPSPTRSNAILTSTTNCLNEIFEEGTDVGSSDSTSTTPRPVIRSQFVAARQQSQPAGNGTASGAAAAASTGNNVHRRTKFNNKSRTASCSSSDASDDDSENRKKRAHKIVDATVKPLSQRRDSHDDSSDSQDQGSNVAGGGGAGKPLIRGISGATTNGSSGTTSNGGTGGSGSGTRSGTGSSATDDKHGASNRQKSSQPVDFRRHRGRRRPVETRLRESQSLNRITEVQESEVGGGGGGGVGGGHSVTQQLASSTVVGTPLVQMVTSNGAVAKPTTEPPNATDEQQSDKSCDNASSDRASAEPEPEPPACREAGTPSSTKKGQSGKAASPRQHHHGTSKPKGLSARIFHTFKKQPVAAVTTTTTAASVAASAMSDPPSTGSADDIEIVVELAKALNNASAEGGKTGNTKKIKILGRYFQVHKKIYVPLSGLFQRGRLYKAQSCGSIVRDKVNVNPNGGGAGSHANTTGRHSTIFTDKNRIIKNCLGGGGEAAARHLGSDGDINHNGGSHHQHHQQLHSSSGFLASLSATGGGVGASSECIGRGSSPIELVSAGRRSSIVDHATPVLGAAAVTPPVPIKTA